MSEFDDKIRRSKNAIEESNINNPSFIYNQVKEKEMNYKPQLNFKRALASSLAILLMIGFMTVVFIVNNRGFDLDSIDRNNLDIRTISSIDEYQAIHNARVAKIRSSANGYYDEEASEKGDTGAPGEAQIQNESPVYETNNQEKEVNEADIVKVDGDYIYYIPAVFDYYGGKSNYVYKLKGQEKECVIEGSIEFTPSKTFASEDNDSKLYNHVTPVPRDMFIYNDYLIVRLDKRYYTARYQGSSTYYVDHYSGYNTEIRIYNKNDLSFINSYEFDGYNLAIRLIDDQLYLVNMVYLGTNLYYPAICIDEEKYDIDVTKIKYFPYLMDDSNTLVSIYRITLADEIKIEDLEIMIPNASIVYVDKSGIYITSYRTYSEEKDDNTYHYYQESYVFPISIKEELKIENMLKIKGLVQDRYWIDAYDNYLRIASTGREYHYDYYSLRSYNNTFNLLTIFKKDENDIWQYYASIDEGLGEINEQIKSVRFNDNYCTIVTFVQTDPLYYIDLTDPLNPIITSELKISGYSGYQHPYKDNYIIGVGYEADERGRVNGLKISLFDASDKDNIKLVGNSLTLMTDDTVLSYHANAINDPREFMFDLSRDIFGFDVVTYERSTQANSYTRYNHTYYVFKIDVDSDDPISIVLKEEEKMKSNYSYYENIRMVFIGSTYYLLSSNDVKVFDDSFTALEKIELN